MSDLESTCITLMNRMLCCTSLYFFLSVSSYLLVVNKLISVPLLLAFNTLETVKIFDSLVRSIGFHSPVLNYIYETAPIIGADTFN
jgi:hypothetical protein